MFCVLLYARVSLSIYSLALDFFLELGIAGDSACLVIYPFSFSCSISALVLINCYVIEISIVYVFQTDIMYYVLRVCYSSFMNYYGILISIARHSDISVSVILWLYFICSKFIYNAVFWAIQVRHVWRRMAENIGLLQSYRINTIQLSIRIKQNK